MQPPDAAIIDLILPDGDGVEVCRSIRSWSEMPILVLSAVGEEEQKVEGARGGRRRLRHQAVRPRELIARLNPHCGEPAKMPTSRRSPPDDLEIDLAAHTVRRDGEEIHLTPIEFRLLGTLARNRGRLMTHRALLKEVWGPGWEDDTQTLRTHIANLRRRSSRADGPRYIRTDPGIGYRFEG